MENNVVGEKINALLAVKNISVQELSERAGLTVAQIEMIQSNVNIPSLASLVKIARALGVRLGTFLDDNEELGAVLHRQKDIETPASFSSQLSTANSHLDFFALAGNKSGRHMEPFIIDIHPSLNNEPILSTHEGEEFIYVLEGSVKIIYGNETSVLHAGDSIYYDSIVDHLVSSENDKPAKIMAVVYTPF